MNHSGFSKRIKYFSWRCRVLDGMGALRGPVGKLLRASNGTGLPLAVFPGQGNRRTALVGSAGGPYNVRQSFPQV